MNTKEIISNPLRLDGGEGVRNFLIVNISIVEPAPNKIYKRGALQPAPQKLLQWGSSRVVILLDWSSVFYLNVPDK
jgi:hypothetical protein